MNEALITGEVLRWARERRGLSRDELAARIKASGTQVEGWERETLRPPFGKAELLAKTLKVPLPFFYLSSPPHEEFPIPDYRTRHGDTPARPSPDLIQLVNQSKTKQEWYREYAEANGNSVIPFVGSVTVSDGVERVARSIASALSVNEESRRSVNTWSSYLTRLSTGAQEVGVLVLRSGIVGLGNANALKVYEFQGFALTDPYAPLVFVNARDFYAAQIFTLLHELTHIWLNQSGVSLVDPIGENVPNIEVFCNHVATEVLVPEVEFRSAWELLRTNSERYNSLARKFWVSQLVILRRAYELQKIDKGEFLRLLELHRGRTVTRKPSGGDPIRTTISRNSLRFTAGVLSALKENRLVYRDAARLLGVRLKGLDGLIAKNVS